MSASSVSAVTAQDWTTVALSRVPWTAGPTEQNCWLPANHTMWFMQLNAAAVTNTMWGRFPDLCAKGWWLTLQTSQQRRSRGSGKTFLKGPRSCRAQWCHPAHLKSSTRLHQMSFTAPHRQKAERKWQFRFRSNFPFGMNKEDATPLAQ